MIPQPSDCSHSPTTDTPLGVRRTGDIGALAPFVLLAALLHGAALALWPTPPMTPRPLTTGRPLALALVDGPRSQDEPSSTPSTEPRPGPAPAQRTDSPAPDQTPPDTSVPGARPGASARAPRTPPSSRTPGHKPRPTDRGSPTGPNATASRGAGEHTPPFLRPAQREQAPTSAGQSQAARTTPAPAVKAAAGVASEARARAALRRRLRQSLGERFRYPALARRRGWQGEVTVGLRVEADGALTRVRVLETSGHAVLDRDAVSTLRRIAYVRHMERWLRGRHFDMVLPVHYRLIDG